MNWCSGVRGLAPAANNCRPFHGLKHANNCRPFQGRKSSPLAAGRLACHPGRM